MAGVYEVPVSGRSLEGKGSRDHQSAAPTTTISEPMIVSARS